MTLGRASPVFNILLSSFLVLSLFSLHGCLINIIYFLIKLADHFALLTCIYSFWKSHGRASFCLRPFSFFPIHRFPNNYYKTCRSFRVADTICQSSTATLRFVNTPGCYTKCERSRAIELPRLKLLLNNVAVVC